MILRLIREPSRDGATLGSLYVDETWVCWALEDQIRDVPGQPARLWKVPGQTAIAAGRYPVTLSTSARFGAVLPLLMGVEGFGGIRIHAGNTAGDTQGCILVGADRGDHDGTIRRSRLALARLMERLAAATGDLAITIENPVSWTSRRAA